MKKKIGQFLPVSFVLLLILSPIFVFAQDKETQPSNSLVYVCTGGAPGECTFDDVLAAVQHLINFATEIALVFAVVVIAVAGGKLMVSEGNPGKIKEARDMFLKVAKGIALLVAAWLIVNLITSTLLRSDINTFLK